MWSYSTSSNKNRNTTVTSKKHRIFSFSSMLLVNSLTVIQRNRKELTQNYISKQNMRISRPFGERSGVLVTSKAPSCCGIFCRRTYIVDVAGESICQRLRQILSPATIYVNVHGTYFRRQQYMLTFMAHIFAGNNIRQCSRHIFSPATIYDNVHGTYFRRQQYMSMFAAHIFAGNNICPVSYTHLTLPTMAVV